MENLEKKNPPSSLPLIGLGTYQLLGKECTRVVKLALEMGYRHIDTAAIYDNHAAIGKAISSFPREQLFLTSKLFLDQLETLSVEDACDLALKELGLEYLDLYLIHWPDRTRPMDVILQEMSELVKKGKARRIGVSNFTIHHLQDVENLNVSIFANQVEFHPYLYQKKLQEFCSAKGIQLVAFRPFGKGALLEDPLFREIGQKLNKTASQVILRWIIQKGVPAIPKASSEIHLRQNLEVFDFALSKADMDRIDQCDRGQRFCDTDWSEFNY